MKKYPIHPDFAAYARLRPPLTTPLLGAMQRVTAALPMPVRSDERVKIDPLTIPVGGGDEIKGLLFSPADADDPAPCLVYFHGGGFVLSSAPYHYVLLREYALRARCRVLFADYRLAPKYPFPTPVNDCFAAWRFAVENADALGVDARRTAVGGDSAGGDLAAAVCLMARDSGGETPCFQMLVYPVTDRRMSTVSMAEFTDTPMWNAELNRKMWGWYLPDANAGNTAYASPMEAESLAGLPDAYIETAEFDCLRDEGAAYARALADAGCSVELYETRGTMHGFDIATKSPIVMECVERRADALRRAFGG